MLRRPPSKPTNSALYLGRSNACLENAKAAALPRIRERSLRAAAAWREMYEKAQLFELRSLNRS
jgi:hypothetical protein